MANYLIGKDNPPPKDLGEENITQKSSAIVLDPTTGSSGRTLYVRRAALYPVLNSRYPNWGIRMPIQGKNRFD